MSRTMKDSGVEWIGEIPIDWDLVKIKKIAEFINGFAFESSDLFFDGAIPIIRIGDISGGEIDFVNCNKCNIEIDNMDRFKVKNNDILIAMSGATVGKLGYAKQVDEIVLINQRVGIIRTNSSRFLYYSLSTDGFNEYIKLLSAGSAQPNISSVGIKNYYAAFPFYEIQLKIASYLDQKVSHIDNIISKTKESIEEYKKYKQSLITETVTKGLNPDVIMKDSGIEWIGEVPEHWEIDKIKRLTFVKGRIGWQGLTTSEFIDEGPFLITGTDFAEGYVNWNSCVHITEERYEEANFIQVQENDLLITKDGTIAKLAIAENLPGKTSVNSGIFVTRPLKNKYVNKFLYYIMISDIFWNYFQLSLTGSSTIIHLYQNVFEQFWIPLPDLGVQEEIVNYLNRKTSEINNCISKKESLITELESYKKSLIYEVVTGKKEAI